MKSKLRMASLILLYLIAWCLAMHQLQTIRSIPQCHEDVVLVGVGDFENGRWSSYACGPAVDDFVTE